jgi:hypothetical protein
MRKENAMTILTLAHMIAHHLGQDWRAYTGKAADGSEANISGPDDLLLLLFSGTNSHRKSDRGRLFISGHLGSLRKHLPYDMKVDYKITVAESKAPNKIAQDIVTRLLPSYQHALKVAQEEKQISDAIDAAREKLTATVTASLPKGSRVDDSSIYFGSVDASLNGRADIRRGDSDSIFKINVPRDLVVDFAHILTGFCNQH